MADKDNRSDRLTHFDKQGNAIMVDVTDKEVTSRRAVAGGCITVSEEVFAVIKSGSGAKGDVLTVATVAGIQGAKKTWELIPMCHPLQIGKCNITWELDEANLKVWCSCEVKCDGKTGVEMEALTGVSAALLTVYDMCKALDKFMEIGPIFLSEKEGGKSGHMVKGRL